MKIKEIITNLGSASLIVKQILLISTRKNEKNNGMEDMNTTVRIWQGITRHNVKLQTRTEQL